MRLGSEVKDGVDVVALQAVHDLGGIGDIALVKSKVALVVQSASVVERSAVVKLVERDNVVGVGVSDGEVTDEPASA